MSGPKMIKMSDTQVVAERVGIVPVNGHVFAGVKPTSEGNMEHPGKSERVELIKRDTNRKLGFVGDGMND